MLNIKEYRWPSPPCLVVLFQVNLVKGYLVFPFIPELNIGGRKWQPLGGKWHEFYGLDSHLLANSIKVRHSKY